VQSNLPSHDAFSVSPKPNQDLDTVPFKSPLQVALGAFVDSTGSIRLSVLSCPSPQLSFFDFL